MALHLSTDLMLVGKLSSYAKKMGLAYSSFSKQEKLVESIAGKETVLIDLQFQGLDISALVRQVRERSDVQIVAYAQHVLTDLIEAADSAGCDHVLTRGQFDRSFAEYLS